MATTAQLPKVVLGDFKQKIIKELAPDRIWVPGKEPEKTEKKEDQEKKLGKIFQALLKLNTFQIPEILIDEETSRLLSRLIDQTSRLGLTVEQYLQSIGKTADLIKKEYRKQAGEAIRLELLLAAIADQEKITVEDKEIEEMIQASGDKNVKKQLQTPSQKSYLKQIL
ncbi:hypothetical protein MUP65_00640, partial [Patescibacteria group bacterium]|nr:hypothetical protein [Patescibacteria group bacterium]